MMSRFAIVGRGILAAIILAATVAPAARAESPPAPAMPGWSSRQAPTGTIYFSCQLASCGGNSVLSIARKAPMSGMTLETFQGAQVAFNAQILQRVPGIQSSKLSPAMLAEIQGVRVFTSPREQVGTSGESRAYLSALLVSAQSSVSVLSEAANLDTAAANFRQFLPVLVKLAWAAP
jgi:hypothetical protein